MEAKNNMASSVGQKSELDEHLELLNTRISVLDVSVEELVTKLQTTMTQSPPPCDPECGAQVGSTSELTNKLAVMANRLDSINDLIRRTRQALVL